LLEHLDNSAYADVPAIISALVRCAIILVSTAAFVRVALRRLVNVFKVIVDVLGRAS
jgi:hypothetical protein